MKKIKVVQLGMGHDHADVINSVHFLSDIFELAGFATTPSEEVDFAKRILEYEQKGIKKLSVDEALAIPDLEAVVIETEEKNLTKYALMAAERGLHIHMDKPGGMELCDFEKLISVVKEKKLVFSTGYMYRFNPIISDLFKRIEAGEIGEIYSVEAHMNCEHIIEKREWLAQFPGGMMFYLGCHLVDLVYSLLGEPEEVIALNAPTGHDGVEADDFGMAVFRYKNGASFVKTCDSEPGGYMRRQLVICGTKGTYELRPLEAWETEEKRDGRKGLYTEIRELHAELDWFADAPFKRCPLYNRYDTMMENYARLIRGEIETKYTPDYELNLYKLVLKACGTLK